VARPSHRRTTTPEGAPSFAHFAKGGCGDGIHNGRCRTDKSCAGSIAAHPFGKLRAGYCKKRKDGAPSVGMVQCKGGPPALPQALRKVASGAPKDNIKYLY
jgi:hypothetical protein